MCWHKHVARATNDFRSYLVYPLNPKQLNGFANENELYRYVKGSYRMFEQAVYEKAYIHSAATSASGYSSGTDPDTGSAGDAPRIRVTAAEVLDTVVAALKEHCQFERLDEVMDR